MSAASASWVRAAKRARSNPVRISSREAPSACAAAVSRSSRSVGTGSGLNGRLLVWRSSAARSSAVATGSRPCDADRTSTCARCSGRVGSGSRDTLTGTPLACRLSRAPYSAAPQEILNCRPSGSMTGSRRVASADRSNDVGPRSKRQGWVLCTEGARVARAAARRRSAVASAASGMPWMSLFQDSGVMGDLLSSFVRDDRSNASTAWPPHADRQRRRMGRVAPRGQSMRTGPPAQGAQAQGATAISPRPHPVLRRGLGSAAPARRRPARAVSAGGSRERPPRGRWRGSRSAG